VQITRLDVFLAHHALRILVAGNASTRVPLRDASTLPARATIGVAGILVVQKTYSMQLIRRERSIKGTMNIHLKILMFLLGLKKKFQAIGPFPTRLGNI
jgi:hypothetical protein